MRVAVFTNQFPSRLNTFFARDMRALVDAGIELDIYPIYPPDPSLWRFVPEELGADILPRECVRHLPLRRVFIGAGQTRRRTRMMPFVRDGLRAIAAASRFGVESVSKTGYTALKAWGWARTAPPPDHVLSYWGNYAATSAYLFHRAVAPDVPFSMFVHARMDLYRKPSFLVPKMLHADNIFLVCEFNRRYIAEHFAADYPRLANRIHIHHLGLDLDTVRYEPDERVPLRIVAVGRQELLKGFHVLLDAVGRLHARGIAVQVELVGDGPENGALRRQVERLGLRGDVLFRGWLQPAETLHAIRRATVLAHPPVSLDAMPTVLKEALAVGTPVVASAVAGIPEILDGGRCGVLVRSGDTAELAGALADLLTDPALRRRLSDAGREHATRLFDARRNGGRLAARLRDTRRGVVDSVPASYSVASAAHG